MWTSRSLFLSSKLKEHYKSFERPTRSILLNSRLYLIGSEEEWANVLFIEFTQ